MGGLPTFPVKCAIGPSVNKAHLTPFGQHWPSGRRTTKHYEPSARDYQACGIIRPFGNSTRLVFSGEVVDSDLVTEVLELQSTYSQSAAEVANYPWNNQEYIARLRTWKLRFPGTSNDFEIEQEIEEWSIPRPKAEALKRLFEL